MSNEGTIQFADAGGVSGTNPDVPLKVLVGPATEKQINTIRPSILPIACWKAEDVNFAFDSSFIQPDAGTQFPRLKALMDQHPGGPLSVFGHADPVGNEEYNKALSGRRAQAVYALLTRRTDLWEDLAQAGDWKDAHMQVMLRHLRFEPGRTDGVMDAKARAMVKEFQENNGLPNDGKVGPQTRKKLFRLYMDALCRDGAGKPFTVEPEMFLGGGKDKGGKGDYQGCSEFNPVLLFSKERQADFDDDRDKTARNAANAPNRRVLVLIYRPGSAVDPPRWPCPRAKEGTGACRKRFWSDADKRKALTDKDREFQVTHDTFRCRFYERMTTGSPCERASLHVIGRLYDQDGKAIPFAPYTLAAGSLVVNDIADGRGFVIITREPEVPKGTITWAPVRKPGTPAPNPPIVFSQEVFFDFDEDPAREADQRLLNLGFGDRPTFNQRVAAFQDEYKDDFDVETGGTFGPKTRAAIKKVHDGLTDDIRDPDAAPASPQA